MRTIKATLQSINHRHSVSYSDEDGVTNDYEKLVAKIMELFPELSDGDFNLDLQWTDSNGCVLDLPKDGPDFIATGIIIPSDATLQITIEEIAPKCPKQNAQHRSAVCGVCGAAIYGHRYTCTVCPQFDICATCEQQSRHAYHSVTRVTTMHDNTQKGEVQRTRLADFGCHWASPFISRHSSTLPNTLNNNAHFGPTDFFHCRNASAFQDFNSMATLLTQKWCGSMPPPNKPSTANASNQTDAQNVFQNGTEKMQEKDSTDGTIYTQSQHYVPKLFSKMVNEMTDNVHKTINKINETPKGQHKTSIWRMNPGITKSSSNNTTETPEPSASEFTKIPQMLDPMLDILKEAVRGDDTIKSNGKPLTSTQYDVSLKDENCQVFPQPVSALSHSKVHNTTQESKDQSINQLISSLQLTCKSTDKPCHCGDPADSKTIHRKFGPCTQPKAGRSREHRSVTPPDSKLSEEFNSPQTIMERYPSPPKTGKSHDRRSPTPPKQDLSTSLAELENMGFKDVGGSLTRFLKEERNDVWSVLERILSDGQ